MQCLRCLNTDRNYFYQRNNQWYCRKCISYGRVEMQKITTKANHQVEYHLDYQLTLEQKEVSQTLVKRYQQGLDTKLKAVCGAGKTEILYDVMMYALRKGQRVCLSIPRRELVKELAQRIQSQFKNVSISVIYGGNTKDITGQLVICTCHQLFRYYQEFDLLILDEEDAFPYQNNEVLQNIVKQSQKGQYIYMSATLSNQEADVCLHTRFHGHPLPIPKCHISGYWLTLLRMLVQIYRYRKENKPVLVYVPQIKDTYIMAKLLKRFHVRSDIAHSQCLDMQEALQKLKSRELDVIVTTTILERGITIANVQVIIVEGHHRIFDRATLLQICGRVGRKEKYPRGDITIYLEYRTKAIRECIHELKKDNAYCV